VAAVALDVDGMNHGTHGVGMALEWDSRLWDCTFWLGGVCDFALGHAYGIYLTDGIAVYDNGTE